MTEASSWHHRRAPGAVEPSLLHWQRLLLALGVTRAPIGSNDHCEAGTGAASTQQNLHVASTARCDEGGLKLVLPLYSGMVRTR
jgi:hypothetical protein